MSTGYVVIGANYGDEGKGLVTDAICGELIQNRIAPMVTRFNGGVQAGHTVERRPYGRRVFHSLGSGTLAGASTHLSPYFIHSPKYFLDEYHGLRVLMGQHPLVYADPRGIITTTFDVFVNHMIEMARGSARHSSCGHGVNETVTRSMELPITVADLSKTDLPEKIRQVQQEWLPQRLTTLGLGGLLASYPGLMEEATVEQFYNECMDYRMKLAITRPENVGEEFPVENVVHVFEGAQGLMLDELHEDFPHVTRSRTGLVNALREAERFGVTELMVHYVSRCYLTRHGNGPLPNEINRHPVDNFSDETNMPNPWQGALRFAPLDVTALAARVNADIKSALEETGIGSVSIAPSLVVTCESQSSTGLHEVIEDDRLERVNSQELHSMLETALGPQWEVHSASPDSDSDRSELLTDSHRIVAPGAMAH